jgi:hypothetical protein
VDHYGAQFRAVLLAVTRVRLFEFSVLKLDSDQIKSLHIFGPLNNAGVYNVSYENTCNI